MYTTSQKGVVGAHCSGSSCLFKVKRMLSVMICLPSSLLLLLLLLLLFVNLLLLGSAAAHSDGDDQPQHKHYNENMLFGHHSIPRSLRATARYCLDTVANLAAQLHHHLFPLPNLEGRINEESSGGSGGATGEKVTAAVGKSVETTKEAVEVSAKSAARMAGDVLHKTTDEVKKTLSQRQQAEL